MTQNQGQISVTAPSNIAFVKYWGKTGRQYPMNPSISMTLKNCITTCHVTYETGQSEFAFTDYQFEGAQNAAFQSRIDKYLRGIFDICPWLKETCLSIATNNSFPHSAGIASSASAFGALGYALAHIEKNLGVLEGDLNTRASFLARLGSGSAARSIDGPFTLWGNYTPENGQNDFAIPLLNIHDNFDDINDTILILDAGEKKISSSIGHSLMDNHPYRTARIEQANHNTHNILSAMRAGDWDAFGSILEQEALSLHAMMMTSNPSYILLSPQSIAAIHAIQNFRAETKLPVYFTIDAGPNIHVIYPKSYSEKIKPFIESDLKSLCKDEQMIWDENGRGAHVL